MRQLFAALVLVMMSGIALSATSQTTQTAIDADAARLATEVSHDILSPFCPGKTLAMCPSPAAAEVRMQIQAMAESGMDEQSIKDAVIEEHGEEFRLAEPPLGDNIGLLIALGAGLGLAVLIVLFISRRRGTDSGESEPAQAASVTDSEVDDPYLAELRKQYKD